MPSLVCCGIPFGIVDFFSMNQYFILLILLVIYGCCLKCAVVVRIDVWTTVAVLIQNLMKLLFFNDHVLNWFPDVS